MDYSSGMLVGKWSSERNILDLMRGESGARIIHSVTMRALPGTELVIDGEKVVIPENGVLKGILPRESLRISSAERVHAKIEYQFEEDML